MRTKRPELYQTSPNPFELAVVTRSLVRHHRPVVEKFEIPGLIFPPETHYYVYDIGAAAAGALERFDVNPGLRLDLLGETKRVALMDFPNYKAIMRRRTGKLERIMRNDSLIETALNEVEVAPVDSFNKAA